MPEKHIDAYAPGTPFPVQIKTRTYQMMNRTFVEIKTTREDVITTLTDEEAAAWLARNRYRMLAPNLYQRESSAEPMLTVEAAEKLEAERRRTHS